MKRNHLLLLAAVVAVVLALVFAGGDERSGPEPREASPLLPGLQAQLNSIDRVEIRGPESASVVLRLADDQWQVQQADGYPADVSRLRETLLKLSDARIVEAKTARPDYYERLGLQGLASADSPTRRLQLNSADTVLADVWIGDRRQGESFVRRQGEDQTWLVSERLDVSTDPVSWLDTRLLDVPRESLRLISAQPRDGEALTLQRAAAGAELQLLDAAEDERPRESALNRLGSALQDLRLRGVAAVDAQVEPGPPASVARFETFAGLAIEARLWQRQEKPYVRLLIGLAEPDPASNGEQRQSASEQAEVLSQRTAGWEFELSEYDGDTFALARADLLENKPAE